MKTWVQGGKAASFKQITFDTSISNAANGVNYVFWQLHRREIYEDLDGSLTQGSVLNKPYFVTPYYAHFDPLIASGICVSSAQWDTAVICDGT